MRTIAIVLTLLWWFVAVKDGVHPIGPFATEALCQQVQADLLRTGELRPERMTQCRDWDK
jgi:hypothetical protein